MDNSGWWFTNKKFDTMNGDISSVAMKFNHAKILLSSLIKTLIVIASMTKVKMKISRSTVMAFHNMATYISVSHYTMSSLVLLA